MNNDNTSMDLISICVYLVIGILGVGYPILFQVVAGLDQKYSSSLIVALFKAERKPKLFKAFLIASVVSIFVWAFKLKPLFGRGYLIVDNSALILVTLSTIGLIILFFLMVQLVLTYYSIVEFLTYLQKKSEKAEKKRNYDYFNAIADLQHFAVQQENIAVCISIAEYFEAKFKQVRNNSQGEPVSYPFSYLDMIYKTIEQLAEKRNSQFQFLVERTAGAIWLLGQLEYAQVSEATLLAIWRNLSLSLRYARFDFVIPYWKSASDYYQYQLLPIEEQSDQQENILNSKEVQQRQSEREAFIQFQCLLGALLIHRKEYHGLQQLFDYTTSIPPAYVLLPSRMGEVFSWFFHFAGYFPGILHLAGKYPFPDTEGAHADQIIMSKVRDYIAVLFLRQYILDPSFAYQDPLSRPPFPKDYATKAHWLDRMELFITHVRFIQGDRDIMEELGLSTITAAYCADRKVKPPIDYLQDYKTRLQDQIQEDIFNQPISEKKKQAFLMKSRDILTAALDQYRLLDNQQLIIQDPVTISIPGRRIPVERSAFGEIGDQPGSSYDAFLAGEIASNFKGEVLYAFTRRATDRYLLDPKQIIPALYKLGIDSTFVVIAFGLHLDQLRTIYHQSLEGISQLDFSTGTRESFGQSVFVLKKDHLPKFVYGPPAKDLVDKLDLQFLGSYNLFAGIADFHVKPELYALMDGYSRQSLANQLVIAIHLSCTLIFEKSTKIVHIQAVSNLINRGIPAALEDVKKF